MLPDLATVRDLERDTLKFLTEIGQFESLPGIRPCASRALKILGENRGGISFHLGFTMDMRLREDRKAGVLRRRVDLGALIEMTSDKRSVSRASYSLIICEGEEPADCKIVRKLHFDYEPASLRNADEPKPTVHLQLGGKLSDYHKEHGYSDEHLKDLFADFEKPRIPSHPTSTALILNWLLIEFQTDAAADKILKIPTWRKHVIEAERKILKPYFEAGSAFLGGAANSQKRFYQSHLYGMKMD